MAALQRAFSTPSHPVGLGCSSSIPHMQHLRLIARPFGQELSRTGAQLLQWLRDSLVSIKSIAERADYRFRLSREEREAYLIGYEQVEEDRIVEH